MTSPGLGPSSAAARGEDTGRCSPATVLRPAPPADTDRWIERLRSKGAAREEAIAALHALLLRATRFEVRRRAAFANLRGGDEEDLAHQSADDALVAVLSKLDDFRGDSRFTTWVYKFGLYEAAVRVRRLSWQEREVTLEPERWSVLVADRGSPHEHAEMRDLLLALREAIERDLSPHQREVVIALAVNEVPIDVLAERLNTTRGALYKTLHDGRRKLRAAIAARGHAQAGEGS